MTKKEELLNPQIVKKDFELPTFLDTQKQIDINTIILDDKEDEDSFFKSVVSQLFNIKDVETKTFNQDVEESFELARMSYLGEHCCIPSLTKIVERIERKRISIDRKGRLELVTALIERQQEIERQRQIEINKGLGVR